MSQSRKLVAIVFTDIVGYTSLIGRDEAQALKLLELNRQLHKDLANRFGGELLKEMGDGTLLSFFSPTEAVRFAIDLQKLAQTNALRRKLRMGIHLGDVAIDNKDVFGEGVNIASRLQSAADPGGIYISEDIQRLVRSQRDIDFYDLGKLSLKNVAHPVKSYAIKAPSLPKPKPRLTKAGWLKVRSLAIGALLLISIIVGIVLINKHIFNNQIVDSVAVMPFDNLSMEPGQEYFVEGMTQTLIAFLGKVSALKVVGNMSTRLLKETDVSVSQIGRELGVDAVIYGSVMREGDMVRIIAQMIDVNTDEVLWSDTYVRDLTSILKLHSEVAQAIVSSVSVLASPAELEQLKAAPLVNADSYENLLKGLYHLYKINPEHYDVALEYFYKALEKDPENASALAGIALVWVHKGQWGGEDPRLAANLAKKYALMALEIDKDLPMANMAMAHVYTSYEWKWDLADEAFNKTISLNPNAPEPRLFYADLLVSLHENERAIAQIEAALEVDPLNAFSHCLKGWVLMATGLSNQAIESMNTSIKSEANIPLSHRCLWTIYHLSEDYERAISHAIHFYRNQDLGETADDLERMYMESGYFAAMKYAGERLAERSRIKFVHSMRVARLYTFCGDKKQALNWLEKAYEERYTSLFSLNVDPHWSSLHQEPRFLALLVRMNLTLRK